MRLGKFGRESETHQLAADNCLRLHELKLTGFHGRDKVSKLLFRFQLREEDHVADALLPKQHHAQAVDADADATRRGHAVFEGDQEIFVELLLLAAGLVLRNPLA